MFGSLRRLRDSFFALAQSRVELAALELQEEKLRLLDVLLRAAGFMALSILALLSATALLVVLFWEHHPVLIIALITAAYALGAVLLWLDLKKRLDSAPPPFADTLAEFKKDAETLQAKK